MFLHKLTFKVLLHFKHFKPPFTNYAVESGSKKKRYVNFKKFLNKDSVFESVGEGREHSNIKEAGREDILKLQNRLT